MPVMKQTTEWTLYYDDNGYPYYYNSITNESFWAEMGQDNNLDDAKLYDKGGINHDLSDGVDDMNEEEIDAFAFFLASKKGQKALESEKTRIETTLKKRTSTSVFTELQYDSQIPNLATHNHSSTKNFKEKIIPSLSLPLNQQYKIYNVNNDTDSESKPTARSDDSVDSDLHELLLHDSYFTQCWHDFLDDSQHQYEKIKIFFGCYSTHSDDSDDSSTSPYSSISSFLQYTFNHLIALFVFLAYVLYTCLKNLFLIIKTLLISCGLDLFSLQFYQNRIQYFLDYIESTDMESSNNSQYHSNSTRHIPHDSTINNRSNNISKKNTRNQLHVSKNSEIHEMTSQSYSGNSIRNKDRINKKKTSKILPLNNDQNNGISSKNVTNTSPTNTSIQEDDSINYMSLPDVPTTNTNSDKYNHGNKSAKSSKDHNEEELIYSSKYINDEV